MDFRILTILCLTICTTRAFSQEWIHLTPDPEKANGRKIAFVTGDDEYKSETSMPMMAHILTEHHGFDCKVLFAINRKTGVIDTNQRDHIPGLEALADADLMVIFTRFRTLVDDQMQMIEDYLATGKPVIGIIQSLRQIRDPRTRAKCLRRLGLHLYRRPILSVRRLPPGKRQYPCRLVYLIRN